MLDFLINIPITNDISDLQILFKKLPLFKIKLNNESSEFLAWGDPIEFKSLNRDLSNLNVKDIIYNLRGHFYFAFFNKIKRQLIIGNSIFSILPLYYFQTSSNLYISNNPFNAHDHDNLIRYNKRFLLENILFNYPLFNESCIQGVRLLPCNSYFYVFNKKISILQHTSIEDYFSPISSTKKNTANNLAEFFIEQVEHYLPEKYSASLTGGLDSRTLTACGLYYKRHFDTYSFGSIESKDLNIATNLAAKNSLPFNSIILDNNYINVHSFTNGLIFINEAFGTASFARAHYLYSSRLLAKNHKYLVTGNFGSELFRAIHVPGNIFSPNLYKIINAVNYDQAIKSLESSTEWEWLKRSSFKDEWESLKADLKTLPCFNLVHRSLTKNQQFYKIVFDEVFRKYFGAEIVNQFHYLINRTPFLDIDFVKAILKTDFAGANSEFFVHSPFKRYKGQVIYAHIIKNAYPHLGRQLLDKGYTPFDIINNFGKIKAAFSYYLKKIKKRHEKLKNYDPYLVNACFLKNLPDYRKIETSYDYFNTEKIKSFLQNPKRDASAFYILSQAWFYNYNFNNK